MGSLRTIAGAGLFIIPVTITFTDKVACASQVIGISMQPLLNPNYHKGKTDWLLQNKMAAINQNLKRGDVITFITPYDPSEMAVKRIVAVEGDLVRLKNDRNTRKLIPAGHVWVEGDNSAHSRDSNNYGPVSMSLITSKVTHIIWPPKRWQKLDSAEIDSDRVVKKYTKEFSSFDNYVVEQFQWKTYCDRKKSCCMTVFNALHTFSLRGCFHHFNKRNSNNLDLNTKSSFRENSY